MTSPAIQAKLWYWQRLSAMALALCVVVHLATIVYAARHGLTAAEILGRTRGNALLAGFYTVFVIACAIHAPIGVKAIGIEWLRLKERSASVAAAVIACFGGAAILSPRLLISLRRPAEA